MPTNLRQSRLIADVKCYYCGHISGQIIGTRNAPMRVSDFVPRPGYTGAPMRPGVRLRCERCQGPVFLEDTTLIAPPEIDDAKLRASFGKPASSRRPKAA